MLYESDEKRFSATKSNSVKVRSSQIAIIDNMKHFLDLYWKRWPTNIILDVGTNNSVNYKSNVIINTISLVENFLKLKQPGSHEIFLNLMNKSGKGMVLLKIWNYGKCLSLLKMYIIDNSNISSEHLNSFRLQRK